MNLPPNRNRWPKWATELFEERAGIIESEALMPRDVAEYYAEMDIRKQASQMDREGKEKIGA